MDQPIVSPEEPCAAVVHALVTRLGDAGKIKIQKLVYFLQEAYGLPLGCRFYMHHYGPYSEDVESTISTLKVMGYVNVRPDPEGYGFHVTPASTGEPGWTTVIENAEEQISNVSGKLGSMEARELELAATIHYVKRSLGFSKGDVVASVRARKPKFSKKLIAEAYDNLASMGLL
jgi:uncharacterized protein YwgA